MTDPRGPGDPSLTEDDGPDTGPWDVLRADDPFDQPEVELDRTGEAFLGLLESPWGLRLDEPVLQD